TETLYRRAILQSDPIGAMRSREAMEQEILTAARAVPDDADLETILQTEAEILSGVKEKGIAKYLKFAPHFGIAPLPPVEKTEARLQEVAVMHELLIGSTTREVSVYGGQIKPLIALDSFRLTEPVIEKIMKGLSASIFIEPADEFARMYALAGGTVYLYTFYWREGKAYLGAGHTIDILPLFGGKRAEGHAIAMGLTADEIAEKGKPMRAVWASFAKDGEPSNLHVSGMLRIHKL
ncbi:MAG: carboxylesterase family protein, partial [Solobacterium sp.]|nr:carboxylesterase family protein [Solobacterium sp.]